MHWSFEKYFKRVRPEIDEAFNASLSPLLEAAAIEQAEALTPVLGSGKKIRGCLACMINESLGGDLQSAIPVAVAVELIQAASLIHDDFVDQDISRRDMPAVWTLEGARRAVLLGDVLFATAIKMMNDLGREEGRAISAAIEQIAKGALHEPMEPETLMGHIQSDDFEKAIYEKIIRLKSGSLFAVACLLGAIAAGAGNEVQAASYRYGLKAGEAYQIADDIQEIRHHIATGSIEPRQMALLAPAFLSFVEEMRPYILTILDGENGNLDGTLIKYFRTAVRLMEDEIERRLHSAVDAFTGIPLADSHEGLIRSAPWELIRIFNRT